MNKLFESVDSLFSSDKSVIKEDISSTEVNSSKARILDFVESGGGCLNYVGEVDNKLHPHLVLYQ